jgi:hypothetical protein
MYNCEIEIANVNLNWRFPNIISNLPSPNSEAFSFLIKGLQPLGLTARSVSLESPTTNLDDVALVLNLLSYKFNIRITYSGVEVEGRDIYSEEVFSIIQSLQVVFDSLETIDSEVKNGIGIFRISLHLNLVEKNVHDYISERVSAKIHNQNMAPEAVVFNLDFDDFTRNFPTKITLAKSLAVKDGLFLDISYQSGNEEENLASKDPIEFTQMLTDHYKSLLSYLELNLIQEEVG